MPMDNAHRPATRRHEFVALRWRQLQAVAETPHGVQVRKTPGTAFQVGDAAHAQVRPAGQLFLRQACSDSVSAKQFPKTAWLVQVTTL
jgi:hypothetical protein